MRDRPPDRQRKGPVRWQADTGPNRRTFPSHSTCPARAGQDPWRKFSIAAVVAGLRDDAFAPIAARLTALRAWYTLRHGAELPRDQERELLHLAVQRRRQLEAAARLYGAFPLGDRR